MSQNVAYFSIMSHLSHLSIKVDFPNPLSPATIKVNSNPEIVRASFNFSIGDKTQKYFEICQFNTKVLEKFSSHLFWQISCAPGWASLRNPHTHLVAETMLSIRAVEDQRDSCYLSCAQARIGGGWHGQDCAASLSLQKGTILKMCDFQLSQLSLMSWGGNLVTRKHKVFTKSANSVLTI